MCVNRFAWGRARLQLRFSDGTGASDTCVAAIRIPAPPPPPPLVGPIRYHVGWQLMSGLPCPMDAGSLSVNTGYVLHDLNIVLTFDMEHVMLCVYHINGVFGIPLTWNSYTKYVCFAIFESPLCLEFLYLFEIRHKQRPKNTNTPYVQLYKTFLHG